MTRLAVLFLVAACGGPPAARPAARAARPRAASPRALPGYPPPVESQAAACVLTGPWAAQQPHELRFRRGARTFASFNHPTRAALSLGEGPGSPFLEVWTSDVHLFGTVVADQVLLHPARPLLLDGYILPGPTAQLRWLGAAAEPVPIEVKLPDFAKPAAPPRAEVRCSDLAIAEKKFDPRTAVDTVDGEQMMLAEKKPIPLAREAKGPAAAVLHFEEGGSPIVEVVERRGDRARVIVHHDSLDPSQNVLLIGWVPASLITPHSHGFGGSWGSAGDGTARLPRPREGWQMVTCRREVPLVVELEGEEHLVGAVVAGVRLEVPPGAAAAGERLVEIVVRSRQMELADDTRLLAKGSALAGCTGASAPER